MIDKNNPLYSLTQFNPPRADREKIESPLEELFIYQLEKHLSHLTEIIPQFEVQTLAGCYRLDFVVTVNGRKIGFECDGKNFHDEWRDEWRDGLILGTETIETIYRFRGTDLYRYLDDCIYIIYHFDNDLFNERYLSLFPNLISEQLKEKIQTGIEDIEGVKLSYPMRDRFGNKVGWTQLSIERRTIKRKGHWEVLFGYAVNNPSLTLKELMSIREKEVDEYFGRTKRQQD
jgi:very-short-patch-repair endonuclease